ncbi:MAG: OsmC family protein [Caldilineaceae bacterium]|nr:OsmC family protein [Caldilineaceae bacterium]MBP8106332.1 OsmC family protein [Caldilineaceae bacterium]MBP8125400.1 OsmC family protein [Caldilineaceae bacterium]MBP9071112.1 OsmC family protein [Caldilineaceae bacterium]
MTNTIVVRMAQVSPTTTEGMIRDHKVVVDRTLAKEGTDLGPMGGELLLAAVGGCFMSTLLAAVRGRAAAVTEIVTTVTGTMGSNPSRFTAIDLSVSGVYADREMMEKLIVIAERGCLVANSIKDGLALSVGLA